MKRKILFLLALFFAFALSAQAGSLQAATAGGQEQTTIDQTFEERELFKSFKKLGVPTKGMPIDAHCDDCRKDCGFCPEYCWGADKECNTCKASGNCPSNCSNCSLCTHCESDGWCCEPWYKGGGSCDPKPSTCG